VKSGTIRSAKESPEAWLIGLAIGLGTSLKRWLDITTVGTDHVPFHYDEWDTQSGRAGKGMKWIFSGNSPA
jgi:hypothetical protein